MLSKKYYNQFAEIVKNSSDKDEMVEMMVMMFKGDNPLFNKDKFLKACGMS